MLKRIVKWSISGIIAFMLLSVVFAGDKQIFILCVVVEIVLFSLAFVAGRFEK